MHVCKPHALQAIRTGSGSSYRCEVRAIPSRTLTVYNQSMRLCRPVFGVLFASSVLAQPTRTAAHVVTGLVFDSVVHAPLVGAVVQIELVDAPRGSFSA